MSGNLISIDIGTSSVKGGIISPKGKLLSWARCSLLENNSSDLNNWDPSLWIQALSSLIIKVRKCGERFDGIVISGNGPTIVPVCNGASCGNALLWIDKRSSKQDKTSYYLHKIEWIKENDPPLYEKSEYFLGCAEFVNYLLCGNAAMISPWDEFDKYIWPSKETSALDNKKLPAIVRSGSCLGKVSKTAAEMFNLPMGLKVYASGSDFYASLVGTAAVKPGRTCDRAGTSEGINYCSENMISSSLLRPLPHAVPGFYNIAGILESTGRIFQWFRKITTQEDVTYNEMLKNISNVPFSAKIPDFFPSTHVHEVWQFSNAVFAHLQPWNSAEEMGRAVVEAIGFAVRDLIETLQKENCPVVSLTVSGGQGRNAYWNQMKADITGKEILIPEIIDAELLGNCCISWTGMGEYNDLVSAADTLVQIHKRFSPDKDNFDIYTERFSVYRERCDKLISGFNLT